MLFWDACFALSPQRGTRTKTGDAKLLRKHMKYKRGINRQ